MAIRPIREPRAPLGSVLMRPIEWAHSGSLRLLEWFNQERWTLTLTLLALLITNSFLLYLLLQGQDTRALAFVIILFVIVLSWLVPELSIAVLIVGGTGLYINLLFYTTGGAFGTGSRPILWRFCWLSRFVRFTSICARRLLSVPKYSHGSRSC
jgi:hypothetical protein